MGLSLAFAFVLLLGSAFAVTVPCNYYEPTYQTSWNFGNVPTLYYTGTGYNYVIGLCSWTSIPECLDGGIMECAIGTGANAGQHFPIAYRDVTFTPLSSFELKITAGGYDGRTSVTYIKYIATATTSQIVSAVQTSSSSWEVHITVGSNVFSCNLDSCGVCNGGGASCPTNTVPCIYNNAQTHTVWNFGATGILHYVGGGNTYDVGLCSWQSTVYCVDGGTMVCEHDAGGNRPIAYRTGPIVSISQGSLALPAGGYSGRQTTTYITYSASAPAGGQITSAVQLTTTTYAVFISVGNDVFSCQPQYPADACGVCGGNGVC